MKHRSIPCSEVEGNLAKAIFAEHSARKTVKPRRALMAGITLSDRQSFSQARAIDWRDYLTEAHQILEGRT